MTPNLSLIMPIIGVIIGALSGATSSLTAGYFADKRKYRMDSGYKLVGGSRNGGR